MHCIIHLPPPVALLTLWTPWASDLTMQLSLPSDHRDYNSSLSPDVIVVKCLLVLLLLQILNAYSFSHSYLPYSSNCFRGAWIQKTPEEFKNENTILIRIASWSSLETNLSNLFSLSLSSGRKWFYWRVKKIYAVLDCIVKWMNWNVFHKGKGYHFLQLESTANY